MKKKINMIIAIFNTIIILCLIIYITIDKSNMDFIMLI